MNKQTLSILVVIAVTTSVALTSTTIIMSTNESENLQKNSQEKQVIRIEGLLPPFTTDDLAKRSQYIIIGKVVKITTTDPVVDKVLSTTTIFSDVTIDVEKDLTGQYTEKQITVRIQGGENEKLVVTSELDAQFSQGERVLVFVANKAPNSIWGDNYYVAGMKLGKYHLVSGKAYGPESPMGVDESVFTTKIENSRNA